MRKRKMKWYNIKKTGMGDIYGYGSAVNCCIKGNRPLSDIEETKINYGCHPCLNLINGECEGAKPGSFYYPTECDGFATEEYWEEEVYY